VRVAIVGSRDWPDLEQVREYVRKLPLGTTIISGGARGVDSAAEEEAIALGADVAIFSADWEKLGRRAGFIRNQDIVNAAVRVVAFWDGESRGTKHTIDLTRSAKKPLEIRYPGGLIELDDYYGVEIKAV
jgi:hypothetical protein